jgi:hypothetical protein
MKSSAFEKSIVQEHRKLESYFTLNCVQMPRDCSIACRMLVTVFVTVFAQLLVIP